MYVCMYVCIPWTGLMPLLNKRLFLGQRQKTMFKVRPCPKYCLFVFQAEHALTQSAFENMFNAKISCMPMSQYTTRKALSTRVKPPGHRHWLTIALRHSNHVPSPNAQHPRTSWLDLVLTLLKDCSPHSKVILVLFKSYIGCCSLCFTADWICISLRSNNDNHSRL